MQASIWSAPVGPELKKRFLNEYLYGRQSSNDDGDEAPANRCPDKNGLRLYNLIGNSYTQNTITAHSPEYENASTFQQFSIQHA